MNARNRMLAILLALIMLMGLLPVSAIADGNAAGDPATELSQLATEGDDPAMEGDDPAPEGDDPAPEGDDPAPEGDDPAPEGDDPAPEGDDPAPEGDDPAPEGDDPAPEGDDPAPEGDDHAPEGDDPAPKGDDPAPEGDDSASEAPAKSTMKRGLAAPPSGTSNKIDKVAIAGSQPYAGITVKEFTGDLSTPYGANYKYSGLALKDAGGTTYTASNNPNHVLSSEEQYSVTIYLRCSSPYTFRSAITCQTPNWLTGVGYTRQNDYTVLVTGTFTPVARIAALRGIEITATGMTEDALTGMTATPSFSGATPNYDLDYEATLTKLPGASAPPVPWANPAPGETRYVRVNVYGDEDMDYDRLSPSDIKFNLPSYLTVKLVLMPKNTVTRPDNLTNRLQIVIELTYTTTILNTITINGPEPLYDTLVSDFISSLSVPDAAGYSIDRVSMMDADTLVSLPGDARLKAGERYTVGVTLSPKANYAFSDSISKSDVTVPDWVSRFDFSNDASGTGVTMTFTVPAILEEVAITAAGSDQNKLTGLTVTPTFDGDVQAADYSIFADGLLVDELGNECPWADAPSPSAVRYVDVQISGTDAVDLSKLTKDDVTIQILPGMDAAVSNVAFDSQTNRLTIRIRLIQGCAFALTGLTIRADGEENGSLTGLTVTPAFAKRIQLDGPTSPDDYIIAADPDLESSEGVFPYSPPPGKAGILKILFDGVAVDPSGLTAADITVSVPGFDAQVENIKRDDSTSNGYRIEISLTRQAPSPGPSQPPAPSPGPSQPPAPSPSPSQPVPSPGPSQPVTPPSPSQPVPSPGPSGGGYFVTEGANSTWTAGSGRDVTITVVRGEGDSTCFSHFTGVDIDGVTLTRDTEYTAVPGSTVVTLKAAKLQTLSPGRHTVTVHFDDGDASTGITVLSNSGGDDRKPEKKDTPTSPKTGDDSRTGLWISLLALSGGGAAAMAAGRKKRRGRPVR